MIMHCIICENEFWCSNESKLFGEKIVKIKSKKPNVKIKTFEIDAITCKHQFGDKISKVKEYYKTKYNFK